MNNVEILTTITVYHDDKWLVKHHKTTPKHRNTYRHKYVECSYFKITLKQTNNVTCYMVRTDKVSEFFYNKLDYLSGDCSITVKGRYPTHKESRKWFVVPPTEIKFF